MSSEGRTSDDTLGTLHALRRLERTEDRYRIGHAELLNQLKDARADAAEWKYRFEDVTRSLPVRLARSLDPILDRLCPEGSLRRRLWRYMLRPRSAPPTESGPPPAEQLILPMALEPVVSIIIPVHNQWPVTAHCLRSIAEDFPVVGYELIVVDDASTDETASRLGDVVGIRVVRLEENRGFLGAVNAGLEMARGRFVVLLNNDTSVQSGWLDALVRIAESDDTVGVVGAKLVYPDGRLQEAGGVIWNDASGHNYGRGEDPNDPRFNFLREVDYCSGACILVRRELLRTLGGLDPRFSPAYYEDTDLCFAARSLGYRVLYQPEAVVCHIEGGSHGTDITSGIKRYQSINREAFFEKWHSELQLQLDPTSTHVRVASWRTEVGRILVVDHQLPMPDHDSGSRRMSELLSLLKGIGFAVTFVPENGITIPRYRDHLQAQGIEVLGGPGDLDQYLQAVGPALRLAILSRPTVAWSMLPMLRSLAPEAKLIYDTVDLHFLRETRRAQIEGTLAAKRSAEFHHDMELALAHLVDMTWVVSEVEARALLDEDPNLSVQIIPNVHRPELPGPPFDHREGLLFVGSYPHAPNRDAAEWLVEEILPLVIEAIPDVTLDLVGSHPTEHIRALASEKVRVLGWVDDLEDIYHRVRLFVAPLRFGAGMKGKIGESLTYGVPVVTTHIGAEGMGLTNGQDVLIADDAETIAAAIVEAYGDGELWRKLAANGRNLVNETYAPIHVGEELRQILSSLGVLI